LSLAEKEDGLMIQNDASSEQSVNRGALAAYDDARQIVRLIQCTQCSRPFRNPVTLPCGNSLCKECLPQTHQRDHISYPDLPGRRHGIQCPFEDCAAEHPYSDCCVDVTLTKVMDSIAETMTKYSSMIVRQPTLVEREARYDEVVSSQPSSEQPRMDDLSGGRLIATYSLAAQGQLHYKTDVTYPIDTRDGERTQALDMSVLQDVLESTQKEVDCQVCYNIMLDPVTTFCGHTLCRRCMARVLDHSQHCPVCRRMLAIPSSLQGHASNKTLVKLLDGLCPEIIATRAETVAQEERGGEGYSNVPLFVCTLGFPNQPTFLRIFEPRYRLMLRRAMEGNRQFGMLMYNRYGEPQGELGSVHFYQYGTMLEIVHAQVLADGTSLIETRGLYRFRVKRHGILDGYCTGDIERIDDVSLAEEEAIEAEETNAPPVADEDTVGQINRMPTRALHALGQEFVIRMQARSANWLQQRVLDIHGLPPDDPALFPYWFASVLPISEDEKYKLLGTRTVRERLKTTATWIRRIETQRWSVYTLFR
jgi:Lon protease-like protein